jgi:hypothetical protein
MPRCERPGKFLAADRWVNQRPRTAVERIWHGLFQIEVYLSLFFFSIPAATVAADCMSLRIGLLLLFAATVLGAWAFCTSPASREF